MLGKKQTLYTDTLWRYGSLQFDKFVNWIQVVSEAEKNNTITTIYEVSKTTWSINDVKQLHETKRVEWEYTELSNNKIGLVYIFNTATCISNGNELHHMKLGRRSTIVLISTSSLVSNHARLFLKKSGTSTQGIFLKEFILESHILE